MADPKRWLATADGASEIERAILAEADAWEPDTKEKDAIAKRLGLTALTVAAGASGVASTAKATTAPGSTAAGAGTAVASKTAVLTSVVKATLVLALVGAAGGAASSKHRAHGGFPEGPRHEASRARTEPARKIATAPRGKATDSRARDDGRNPAPTPSAPAASSIQLGASHPTLAPTTLDRDVDDLVAARQALRAANVSLARKRLETLRDRSPRSVLDQEIEALLVEIDFADGDREAGRARAGAFLRAYPESPHASRVKMFVR